MKKIFLLILLLIIFVSCTKEITKDEQGKESLKLTELQITACVSADEGGTCDTKLPELNIVTKEKCCQSLGKCC